MPSFVRRNAGYKLSSAASIKSVDMDRLALELSAKDALCEYPDCNETAWSITPTGTAALLCYSHLESYNSSPRVAVAMERAIQQSWQHLVSIIAHAAYESSEGEVVVTFDGTQSLGDAMREAVQVASKLNQQQERLAMAEAEVKSAGVGKVDLPLLGEPVLISNSRPTLSSLENGNQVTLTFDLFDAESLGN